MAAHNQRVDDSRCISLQFRLGFNDEMVALVGVVAEAGVATCVDSLLAALELFLLRWNREMPLFWVNRRRAASAAADGDGVDDC